MEEWLLLLSFHLAVLTYYTGTLIYALPIPWRGIKRWGPELIYDGAVSAVLVFAFTLIVASIEYLRLIAGGGWSQFYSWIIGRLGVILSYQLLASTIAAALSSASGFSLGGLLWPHLKLLSEAAIVLDTVVALGLVIQHYYVRMLAIGVMLYAIPFRAARTAGAALIAFTIVFYVALPLMPAFVDSLASSPIEKPSQQELKLGVSFAEIYVYDSSSHPIPGAEVLVEENSSIVAEYPTSSEGIADAGPPDNGLPSTPYRIKIEYSGLMFRATPDPVRPAVDYRHMGGINTLEARVPSMLCLAGAYRPIAISDPSPSIVETNSMDENGSITISILFKTNGGELYVTLLKGDQLYSLTINNTPRKPLKTGWKWRGIEGSYYKITLNPGSYTLTLTYHAAETPKPRLEEKPYLTGSEGDNIRSLTDKVSRIIFSWVVLPVAYLLILILATYSLAYTLGGRGRIRIPVRV